MPPRIGSSMATQAMKSAISESLAMSGSALQVGEARVAEVHARGLGRAVGQHETADLAARGLDRRVDLARRHPEALGHELEVVNQRLHRGGQLVAGRQRDLAIVGGPGALGEAVERLLHDSQRLAHLVEADLVAVVVVAHTANGDVEVEVLVARVGHRLAQVPGVAGGAQQRPRHAELERTLLGDHARVLQSLQPDLVAARAATRTGRCACGISSRNLRTRSTRIPAGCPRSRRPPGSSEGACAGRPTSRTGRARDRGRGSPTRAS